MIMNRMFNVYTRVAVLVVIVLPGCSSMQAMSSYARSGDTVMIALGGDDGGVTSPVIKKENIIATITDSQNHVFNIKVRNVFKVNADQTSAYNNSNKFFFMGYVDSYQSEWLAIIDLVDPVTNSPVVLSTGNAKISLASPDINEGFFYNNTGSMYNGNLTNVPIEILAGQGNINPINYTPGAGSSINNLEPLPQLSIRPIGSYTGVELGGVQYVFSYLPASFGTNTPNVATQIPDSKSQLSIAYLPQTNGTMLIKVLLMNPNGYMANTSSPERQQTTKSPYKALNLSVFWLGNNTDANITDANWHNAIQLVSAKYIDTNGNQITALTPTIQKVR